MKRFTSLIWMGLLTGCGGLFHSDTTPVAGGLVAQHGKLQVIGRQLSDAKGVPMQLRGVSLFWINWHILFN